MKPFFCFATLLVFFVTHQLKAAEKPNVILILCDDVGFECFGSYGSREYATPRLDALAANGVRLRTATRRLSVRRAENLMSGKSNVFNYFDFVPRGPAHIQITRSTATTHRCRQVAAAYRKGWYHARAAALTRTVCGISRRWQKSLLGSFISTRWQTARSP